MPLNSASRLASRLATVFDFLPALARRHLSVRVGLRGTISVVSGAKGVFTLVHQHRVSCGRELAEDRIAQLRESEVAGSYQLFWKKGNGRWTAYTAPNTAELAGSTNRQFVGPNERQFVGSIDECLTEIARDPSGCFWS